MKIFRVTVTNVDVTKGIGPAKVIAESPDEAKLAFAIQEGTTLEKLEQGGFSWWAVEELV